MNKNQNKQKTKEFTISDNNIKTHIKALKESGVIETAPMSRGLTNIMEPLAEYIEFVEQTLINQDRPNCENCEFVAYPDDSEQCFNCLAINDESTINNFKQV